MEPFSAPLVRIILLHDGRKSIQELVDSRSHGSAEAVHNNAPFKTHRSRVREKRGYERAERAHVYPELRSEI